ncbi:2-C-methyl-D-erythritol 4-phosphate cytidylyltransferase [Calycomorphotria hydatis]|uniref:2-C-methyl-D-erythritol 4-phosphate cytidylyltransferase n=1 Tax=Calycomorphotria hydatis TaxID=2528027 RepID=A0A517T9P4_9PLAN|nr:2-C-methyl-D-erythritol 4-phosphate cytidylyltransferase [Calycomorphotria hydatis]QDT65079.1 2-C-methyl-D-erythritol 4-phosphate cytidylyltransferase [Calycomorphotria hydatis]
MLSQVAVILAAAGKSTRFSAGRRKKPFVDLKGRPMWVRCADLFANRDDVGQMLITVAPDDIEWFQETFRANLAFMNIEVVPGGAERADSVENAIARVRDEFELIAVHDAARPLVTKKLIDQIFEAAKTNGAAIPATKIANTIKRVDSDQVITETVDRNGLWGAQTPQVASADLLREAFAKRDGFIATDEAQLIERIGAKVAVVEGSAMNFKITTRDDFKMAEALIDLVSSGSGSRPLHPFAEGPGSLFDADKF